MWPSSLGLMLYNGANGLIYYSGQASRVFVSNAGLIATVAVGGYFFPEETMAGLAGAVAIRGVTWLTKTVEETHHVHIADGIDKLLDVVPTRVALAYRDTSLLFARPQRRVSTEVENNRRLRWVNDSLATELISPLLEESIYRLGLQQALAWGLTKLGVPERSASFLSIAISSSLFAGGHDVNPGSAEYKTTLVSGIGFGLMMHLHGLPAAVVAHSANNAGIRLEKTLRS